MSDLHLAAAAEMSDDAIYQQIVVAAAAACRGWAVTAATSELDIRLYPADWGPDGAQHAYLVTQRVVEKGVWRITLCPEAELPAWVPLSTRDSIVKAQIARSALHIPLPAMDHIVQCGLFGEVLYR